MTQAIGYVRRSTDRQDLSLEQQRAKLEQFAVSKGWQLVHVFSDDAISGSDMDRPGLHDMIRRVEEDKSIGVVLAWDRNRLARPKDPIDGMMLERRLMAAGKRVLYAATGQEADRSFASGLISYVEHHQNGDYLRKLSRDTARGILSRVERGLWPGGPIPFGYDRLILDSSGNPRRIIRDMSDGTQSVLDPSSGAELERLSDGQRYQKQEHESCTLIPSEASRVRALQKMFSDCAAGLPSRRLRDDLNATGFRTSRGSRFTLATILPMLENPVYLGHCVYNRRTLSKWHRLSKGNSVERTDEGVERRPEVDWIVTENAWPALIDPDTFAKVQTRRHESREQHYRVTGHAIKAEYLLTGLMTCGICGALLMGQTCTSGKGYRTRYYICSAHHRGDRERCPKRYTVPANLVEGHIAELLRSELLKLRDNDRLHEYIAQEVARVTGHRADAVELLQRRLAELDQRLARLREHVLAVEPGMAKGLGLYDQAQQLTDEREALERDLKLADVAGSKQADAEVLRARAAAAFDALERVLASGTLEEKRCLIGAYVQKIKAEPDHQLVRISLYPAIFTREVAGAGFEPATSGL